MYNGLILVSRLANFGRAHYPDSKFETDYTRKCRFPIGNFRLPHTVAKSILATYFIKIIAYKSSVFITVLGSKSVPNSVRLKLIVGRELIAAAIRHIFLTQRLQQVVAETLSASHLRLDLSTAPKVQHF